MKSFVIAEAGANHNRSYDKAKELIDVAISTNADAVKFQLYSSETLYSKYTPDFSNYKDIPRLIKNIEFPREWHKDLKKYCDDNDIEFMSTPFDEWAIDELFELGVKRIKIASFEAGDPRIIKHAAETKLPLIISVGAAMRGHKITIKKITNWVKSKNSFPNITFLHCNSSYPTPLEDVNLQQIKKYQKEIDQLKNGIYSVGFSDHTMSTIIPAHAFILGARVIEKHFTLNREDEGPDHPFSLEPNELKEMVDNIRNAEKVINIDSVGNNLTESEKKNDMIKATRSIVAKINIEKGELLTRENITTKRPFIDGALPAHMFYDMVGTRVLEDIQEDEIIKTTQIKEKF